MRLSFFATAFALLGAAACGSNVTGAGGAGSTGDAGKGGGAAASPCPATEPSGGSCSEPGRHCTYGTSPRPECRDEWICSAGTWVTTKGICLEPAPGVCSGLPPSPDGVVCANDGDVCVKGTATLCMCTSCVGGQCMVPPPKWACAPPPTTQGCPELVPNMGTACATSGLECAYGPACTIPAALRKCVGGIWIGEGIVCSG